MAKKRAVNKSQAIRDYLAANPKATANEIVAGLRQQGISVSAGLVSNVKYTSGRPKRGPKRRGRPAKAQSNGAFSVSDLVEAKKLADQLGGIEQARQALATLEELR